MDDETHPWERWEHEPARNYQVFRLFRDLGPLRKLEDLYGTIEVTDRTIRQWSYDFAWAERATAWDDTIHQAEDRQRLESLRDMHRLHREAGRSALEVAVQALGNMDPTEISPTAAARLLELGARLERETLMVSVEDLQGRSTSAPDEWEAISRELAGAADGSPASQ